MQRFNVAPGSGKRAMTSISCGDRAPGSARALIRAEQPRAEAPVDADLHGVDVRELMVEAERSAGHRSARGERRRPAAAEAFVASAINMYSALMLQLGAKAHSTPPPKVPTVTVSSTPVAISQLPQPAGTV